MGIRKSLKGDARTVVPKFATTLKQMPTSAKCVRVSIKDFGNKFVYAIEWKDEDKISSCILRSNEELFSYTALNFDGALLGFGTRLVASGYKIFAAT